MITQSLLVRVSPERAFAAWTRHVDLWWPPSHRVSGRADTSLHFEAGVEGRLLERTASGEVVRVYGRITAWEPSARLAYDFYLGSSPERPTDVQVRFTAVPEGTQVDVEHRPGRMDPEAWEGTNGRFAGSWPQLFAGFSAYLDAPEHRSSP